MRYNELMELDLKDIYDRIDELEKLELDEIKDYINEFKSIIQRILEYEEHIDDDEVIEIIEGEDDCMILDIEIEAETIFNCLPKNMQDAIRNEAKDIIIKELEDYANDLISLIADEIPSYGDEEKDNNEEE